MHSGLPVAGFIATVFCMEFDLLTYGLIASSFLLAGFVKGIVGLGLPTISLALLTALLDLPTAMALLVVPSFCTNVWQAVIGGHLGMLWRRLWPLLLAVMLLVWVGVALSDHFETVLLTRVLGAILLLYAALSLYAVPVIMPLAIEPWLAPICGALNGVLTGLTGSLFMPGVIYLQAMGLSRDQLVQAMGLLFALSTAALGISLQDAGRIDPGLWQISALALVLSGCSIVVFEDGPDCPAAMECPVAAMPSIDAPNQPPAAAAVPAQSDQTELAETETDARQPLSDLLMTPPLIDGYVTNFAYDSAELGSQAIDDLKAIAAFLADNGDIALVIEGHCDERGSRDYNLALGARRAIAMRDVLTANGVDANRIKTVSYGKERPIIVGSTPEAWARNRRAVIRQQAR